MSPSGEGSPGGRVRVLIVLWRLSRGGGIPRVVRGFLKHHDASAFDVHVCTVRPRFREDALDRFDDHVSFHHAGLEGAPTPYFRLRSMVRIARLVRRLRPDVLHLHGGTASYGLLAAAAPGSRKLLEIHDAPQSGRMSRANRAIERFLVRQLGFRPLVHSRGVRDSTAAAWGLDPAAIHVLPLGIDTDRFAADDGHRAETRARLGVPEGAVLVTYVARLVPEKRPELFLETAERVLRGRPGVQFLLAGGGPELAAARSAVERLGIGRRVEVAGYVDDLVGVYRASDVFLSTSAYEGFGLAIAEAMSTGVAVVSTRVGGVEDVIADAGVLVSSDDPGVLADRVIELLDDPARRGRLAAAAAARAREHLDVRGTTRGFEACYRDLVGDSQ